VSLGKSPTTRKKDELINRFPLPVRSVCLNLVSDKDFRPSAVSYFTQPSRPGSTQKETALILIFGALFAETSTVWKTWCFSFLLNRPANLKTGTGYVDATYLAVRTTQART